MHKYPLRPPQRGLMPKRKWQRKEVGSAIKQKSKSTITLYVPQARPSQHKQGNHNQDHPRHATAFGTEDKTQQVWSHSVDCSKSGRPQNEMTWSRTE